MVSGGVEVARIYDPAPEGGRRVLVDRLWPRGISKADARLAQWLRDIAPSTQLRRWYGHQPERFEEFRRRYLAELADADHAEALAELEALARQGPLTLVTATKDLALSHAQVLADRVARPKR